MRMRTILIKILPLSLLLLAPLVVAACGPDEEDASTTPAVQVSASTTQIADLAANVAGDRAEVRGILAANSDPHDYEPQPSDAEALLDADLLIASGGDLDLWVEDLAEGSGADAPTIELIESVETIEGGHHHEEDEQPEDGHSDEEEHGKDDDHGHSDEEEHGKDDEHAEGEAAADPHWWQDPTNAILAVEAIRDALIDVDPEGADDYEANADTYIEQLTALDSGIAECIEAVPAEERKLVTSHEALGYFADRYEIEVVGAALPALTTQAQPSAGETAELVELIEDEGVSAVFPEAGLNADLEEAIAGDAGVTVGGELWADTLGPEGSGAETYVDAMAANATTMVEGFTAGRESCAIEA
jgi:zinc/manganese transport system substrate-binding protein